MSDAANEGYRSFARGAIAAVITINSGALVAVLSQFSSIEAFIERGELSLAFHLWTYGVVTGTSAWGFAAMAAQAYAHGADRRETIMAYLGIAAFIASLAFFLAGSLQIACGLTT